MICTYCDSIINTKGQYVGLLRSGVNEFYHVECAKEIGIDIGGIQKISKKETQRIQRLLIKRIQECPRSKEESIKSFEDTLKLMELITTIKREGRWIKRGR